MIIIIDETRYEVDDKQIASYIKNISQFNLNKQIKLGKYGSIDLSRKSVLSTLLRQVIVSLIVPLFFFMADTLNTDLPIKEKHSDSLVWSIAAYSHLLEKALSQSRLTIFSEIDESNETAFRKISSFELNKIDSTSLVE